MNNAFYTTLWITLFIVSMIATHMFTPVVIRLHYRRGLVGRDMHKKNKPIVAEAGGLSILVISLLLLVVVSIITEPRHILPYILALLCIGLAGYADDLRVLDARTKTLLPVVAGLPIIVFSAYVPKPYVPLIGPTRLTILYPVLMLALLAVVTNATNMADTHNGVVPSTSLIIGSAMLVAALYAYSRGVNEYWSLLLYAPVLGSIAGYLPYNWYPARTFNGDTGSLYIGAALGILAIASRTEVVLVTAMMPYIVNGFHSLLSIGGLLERREIKIRPVILDENNETIIANKDPQAPMTMVNLLTLKTPLREKEILVAYILLTLISSILAIITAMITY